MAKETRKRQNDKTTKQQNNKQTKNGKRYGHFR
nr:MAG TPA_asm: hypothetical protein [Caudoviricetes sp.]